jgi:hypothetical protein
MTFKVEPSDDLAARIVHNAHQYGYGDGNPSALRESVRKLIDRDRRLVREAERDDLIDESRGLSEKTHEEFVEQLFALDDAHDYPCAEGARLLAERERAILERQRTLIAEEVLEFLRGGRR